eukprot:44468_1
MRFIDVYHHYKHVPSSNITSNVCLIHSIVNVLEAHRSKSAMEYQYTSSPQAQILNKLNEARYPNSLFFASRVLFYGSKSAVEDQYTSSPHAQIRKITTS